MKRLSGLTLMLFSAGSLLAQQFSDGLGAQFQNYQSRALQEKLYVHTDKSFYLAGETVWLKIYEVDASFHKPFSISSVAYIEVLNNDLKPVIQSKIHMKSGWGSGSFVLPVFLINGNYILRAYTSWMKNFPADYYYEQTIHIVNTLKISPAAHPVKQRPLIQFFPEGGNLVAGIPTIIAFKTTDSNGHFMDCQGVIVNQKNDTVTKFVSLHNGMGRFNLNPVKNEIYYALFTISGITLKQKLPDASEEGFVMNVSENETGKLEVSVHCTSSLTNNQVYLLTQTRQALKNVQSAMVVNGETSFVIDKKDLGEGISSITLFDQARHPLCERLVFKRPADTLIIQMKLDQEIYNKRKNVNIDLSISRNSQQPVAANFSVSVFLLDSLQHLPQQNIISYLFLGSDLKGRIESPEYYFQHTDKNTDQALDNLLLTQGWRRFKWDDVLSGNPPDFEFLPELEGLVVNGRIINKATGQPVKQSVAYLSIPGADYAFSSATSSKEGIIRFAFVDIYKNNVIVVEPALQKDSNSRIDISNAFSDKFSSFAPAQFSLSRYQKNEITSRSIGNQVENTFNTDKKKRILTTILDTTSFFGMADRTYNLDDYTRFQTMEEVIREYVDDVRLRKDGNKNSFRVRNQLFNTYFEDSPLILLDGVPILDASRIIALDPAKIKKIEVVTHRYYTGSSSFDGIINVHSFTGELGVTQIDPNALVVEYEGLQQMREFYSPQYPDETAYESHIPDFRNLLYWAPEVRTDLNGKSHLSFYTSDLNGKYAVIVQGLSALGQPGAGSVFFEVNDYK